MGLVVERYPLQYSPRKRLTTHIIPGRSEPLTQWDGSWEPVPVRYQCWFKATPVGRQARKIKRWLHGAPAGARLEDTYDSDVWRKATYVGGVDIENCLNRFGRFDVEFQASAEQFLASYDNPLIMQPSGLINNPTPWTTKPLIAVTGSVSGGLTIGDQTMLVLFEGYNDQRTLYIDCAIQEAWEVVDGVEISRNAWIASQGYPVIAPGVTEIRATGGIEYVRVWPRVYDV